MVRVSLVSPIETLIWGHGNKISLTAMECTSMLMDKNIKESSQKARNQDEECTLTTHKLGITTKENSVWIRKMGLEYFSTPTMKNMKEIG